MSEPGASWTPRYPFTPGDLAKLWAAYFTLTRVGNQTARDGTWDELLDAAQQKLGVVLAMMRAEPPDTQSRPTHLLGKRVRVTLHGTAVTDGVLLGFGTDGEFEIDKGDGDIHYCWPMLTVEPLAP